MTAKATHTTETIVMRCLICACCHVSGGWHAALKWPLDMLSAADAWVCDTLKQHIRPLVSAGLIVSTLLGALLLAAFFTVQMGGLLINDCICCAKSLALHLNLIVTWSSGCNVLMVHLLA